MRDQLSDRFALAQDAARRAGRMLAENLRRDFQVSKKGRINLVTEMDLRSESLIIEAIRSRFPEDEILSEEEGTRPGDRSRRWVIDPLDGTTNYAHGYRFFCVSIAFELEGEIALGVVYDPVTEEMFTARRGEGAFLNADRLRVSSEAELLESLLCTGFPYDIDAIRGGLELFERVLLQSRAVRRDGSAALDLCYVAAGRFEGFWERGLQSWDVAAGQLIVREAEGAVTALDGSPVSVYDREILASNGHIHQALVQALAREMKKA